jgi:hypothetical protein
MPDCIDTGFIPDGPPDELPLPVQDGAVRTGGIDLNTPRIRAVFAAAAAQAPAPGGSTAAGFADRARSMTRQESHTVRQAAHDLCKLRGKSLALKPGRSRRCQVPDDAAPRHRRPAHLARSRHRPIPAGVRSPAWAASPLLGPGH